ncbi:MAG: hypothetical protein IJ743_05395 [Bacilli bacterium]|nr:hypothetical protein [Bacilli bacterium]MBR1817331.1 hypothetical protein [Bacilli bacterium]
MNKEYEKFLKQIFDFEKITKNKKLYSAKGIPEKTKAYIYQCILANQKEINVKRTLEDWKLVKSYLKRNNNYEIRLHMQAETHPIYISMLYLMNHKVFELFPIYKDIITEKLYNPNAHYDLEGHRIFWENLPNPFTVNNPSLIELNKMVMQNRQLDFHQGGTNYGKINFFLDDIDAKSLYSSDIPGEKKYLIELLYSATQNNLNLLDTHREVLGYSLKKEAYIKKILAMNPKEIPATWQSYKDYLFSLECIRHQCELSWNADQLDDEAVDMYINALPQDEQYKEKKERLLNLKRGR